MLKINRNDSVQSVKFSNIKVGGLFTHDDFNTDDDDGNLYVLMKVSYDEVGADCCKENYNSVCLDDGQIMWVSEDDEVNPIVADLNIISGKTTY